MKKVYDVVIIGAGLAGLSAALEAKQHNLSYVVIDAKDRIGGRIFSKKLKGGLVVELGAEWIGKTHKELLKFCRTHAIELESHRYTDVRYYTKEKEEVVGFDVLLKKFEDFVLKQKEANIPVAANSYDFLKKNFSEEEMRMLSRVYGPDFGTHLRYVSARDVFRELHSGGANDHMDYHVKGGNSKIIEALIKAIGKKNIHIRDEVKEVVDTKEAVEVKTKNSHYVGRKVVLTIGLKQLKGIHMKPSLKHKRVQAQKLSYGDITKAFITFKGNLPVKKQKLAFFTETDIQYVYVTTQGQSEKRFGLCVYAIGAAAKNIAKMSQKTFINKVIEVLPEDVFEVEELQVEDVYIQHWGKEAFTEGAYCIFNPFEHDQILESFGRPHGNIYFAGDYLGIFFNYMNGAFQSGRDAIREIVKETR